MHKSTFKLPCTYLAHTTLPNLCNLAQERPLHCTMSTLYNLAPYTCKYCWRKNCPFCSCFFLQCAQISFVMHKVLLCINVMIILCMCQLTSVELWHWVQTHLTFLQCAQIYFGMHKVQNDHIVHVPVDKCWAVALSPNTPDFSMTPRSPHWRQCICHSLEKSWSSLLCVKVLSAFWERDHTCFSMNVVKSERHFRQKFCDSQMPIYMEPLLSLQSLGRPENYEIYVCALYTQPFRRQKNSEAVWILFTY